MSEGGLNLDQLDSGVRRAHEDRVDALVRALRRATEPGVSAHIDKGGVHHVVPLPGDRRFGTQRIDTSALVNILHIDPEQRVCIAEPGVDFESLVRATLPLGLVPVVVPELRGITIGGAVAGCSLESMSYRYGGFHDGALWYEVVSTDGAVHLCSRDHNAEMFEHLHGSYGTLGILTCLAFTLVPAKPYVEMTYRHHRSFAEFEAQMLEWCDVAQAPYDLVDAIIYGPDHLVLCGGRFVDEAPHPPSDYTRQHIYYRSVEQRTSDVMTTEQYLFRYDTECHWLTATVAPLQWRPVRSLLGKWLLGSSNLIAWSNRLAPVLAKVRRRPDVVCDVFLPEHRFGAFWDWYCKSFAFWPLWVVPYRPALAYPWLGEYIAEEYEPGRLFIDAAVYGKRNTERHCDYSKDLEDEVYRLHGIKTLIGRNHYSKEKFWTVYDRERYLAAKSLLDPVGLFPDLYDKLGQVD